MAIAVLQSGSWAKRAKAKGEVKAEAVSAIFSLVKTGTLKEIKRAIKEDKRLSAVTDENGDTILMSSIKAGRDNKVVSYLLETADKTAQNNAGESAVTYACRYSSDKKVIKSVITAKKSLFEFTRTKLLRTDNSGITAYERTFENPSPVANQVASKYLRKKDIKHFAELHKEQIAPPAPTVDEDAASGDAVPDTETKDAMPQATVDTPPALPPAEVDGEKAQKPSITDTIAPYAAGAYTPKYLYEYAAHEGGDEDEAADYIPDANKRGKGGVTRLMTAAKKGNEWEVNALLNSGARVNDKDDEGWNALMYAARYQMNANIVKLLLSFGSDALHTNKYGFTALSIAASYNENPMIIEQILSKFPAGDNEVFRSLIAVITAPSSEEVRCAKMRSFMEHGVPLNRYWEGKTPLMYAAYSCRGTEAISMLLDNGAIASLADKDGKRAFDYAKDNVLLPHDEVYWSLNRK